MMISIIIIIIIILIIALIDRNSRCKNLLEENKKLREKLKAYSEPITNREAQKEQLAEISINQEQQVMEQYLKEQRENQQELIHSFKEDSKINRENKIRKEKEQKNIAILATGAVCIVLSAIVFLLSTWDLIPNILKTIVLSLLTLVFFGGSYIAKEKFKLDKASQTFFYIAMAYIPICLFSIAIFELFGTYLSIYGEGKYIYMMVSSLFVAFVYYATYVSKNNKYLLYGSLLSQAFSVVAFSLVLSNDVLIIGINLLLYNILLVLITKKDIFIKVYNFIPAAITFLALTMLTVETKMMSFMLFLLTINFLILELKNSRKIYSYMFNIFLMVLGIYTVTLFNDILGTNISHLIILCFVLLVYIIENMNLAGTKRKNLINSLTVVIPSTIGVLHIESFINTSIVTPYMISILQLIILIITYIKSKIIGKNITATLIPIYFIITGLDIMRELNCSYHLYIIFAVLTFMIGEIFRNRYRLIHLNIFNISHIFIALTYIVVFTTNFNDFANDIFYAVLLTALYFYSYLVQKKIIFKYLSYITSNFAIYTLFRFFAGETKILYYVPMISTLAIMGIEFIYKKLQDDYSDAYLGIFKVISFILIYLSRFSDNSDISTMVAMIFSIIIILDNFKHKNSMWNILPLTCVIPAIFFNNLNTELEIGIMLLSVIATAGMSIKERKVSIFTVFSGIYLFFTSLNIESVYLKEILFICWSVVHFLFITAGKGKDVFKFLVYLSILFLYNSIIADLQLETYTLFDMLGYVLIAMFTLRTILIKYISNIDIWEYIVFGLLYLSALLHYNNEIDGMLFGILLVAVVIASYINKYGALFMVSIFAILANIFVLTREFWFSVPWWVYLLTVGAILIGFAIKNEVSDKKSEINAIEFLKNLKDKIEK